MKCEKCGGTGKVEKPVSLTEMGMVDCEECEGTGEAAGGLDDAIERLDRIIGLLEQIAGGKQQ